MHLFNNVYAGFTQETQKTKNGRMAYNNMTCDAVNSIKWNVSCHSQWTKIHGIEDTYLMTTWKNTPSWHKTG